MSCLNFAKSNVCQSAMFWLVVGWKEGIDWISNGEARVLSCYLILSTDGEQLKGVSSKLFRIMSLEMNASYDNTIHVSQVLQL